MVIPEGYKQTEIGVIPEDWKVEPFSNLFSIGHGKDQKAIEEKDGEFPILATSGVIGYTNKFLYDKPSALIGRKGTINKPQYIEIPFWTIDTLFYTKGFDNAFPKYIYYIFCVIDWLSLNEASGVPSLSAYNIEKIRHAIPPLREQKIIANALSDVDKMIYLLEKLIAKKKSIKQGAMQELLTGKKRLPGFAGKWILGKWKDVLDCFSSGATPYRGNSEFYKGTIKWVSSGELNYNYITDTLEHISYDAQVKTNLTLHPAGTFLMAITGLEAAGTRGSCAILGAVATTNQSCMAIYETEKMSTEYLFHYYVQNGNELAIKYCQGTKQQSYTAAIVKELPIYYPEDVAEQNAIASILFDMDNEIETLEQKLAKTRQLKQGMMQQLLTGKIRLV